jgi:hypothetical protein
MLARHFALQVVDEPFIATIGRETTNENYFKNLGGEFEALGLRSNIQSIFGSASLLLSNERSQNIINCFKAILL